MANDTHIPQGDPVAARRLPVFEEIAANPDGWALFLDIDGTLLELAETPHAIVVPPALPILLSDLSTRLDGALALVTGRALAYADRLFEPRLFPTAGLHGAERRDPSGAVLHPEITPAFAALKSDLAKTVRDWPGVLLEDKGAAVALHYRQAPERQADVEDAMRRASLSIGGAWGLQSGKMVVELRPATASKGAAVSAFLSEPPFRGRRPLTIGDDVTDEAMFSVANTAGGMSIRIGPPDAQTEAKATLGSVADLRRALEGLVA